MGIGEMRATKVHVGDTASFKHRLNPNSPLVEEVGKILSTGVTLDAKFYVETTVGSHTKKFILNQ